MYKDLDNQLQMFIDKYLETLDPTQSAIDSGMDRKSAQKIGLELLLDNNIKDAIDERRIELNNLISSIQFEKEDLLRIYWSMFNDCKKKGKLTDARNILSDIAKYNGVNPDEIKKEIAVLNFNLDKDKI